MADQYFEGVVDTWIADGKNYGFISYNASGRERRVFFPGVSIRLDSLGRRSQGALIRFRIADTVVHPVFQEEQSINLDGYREVSQVVRLHSDLKSGWLRREDGSEIFFHRQEVVPDHLDRFESIRVSDRVYHGVCDIGQTKWRATFVEIFSREEQEKLQRGESLESEPEPEPEPEPVPVDTVLAPSKRGKTIAELIVDQHLRK
jgi:hypothetical protein